MAPDDQAVCDLHDDSCFAKMQAQYGDHHFHETRFPSNRGDSKPCTKCFKLSRSAYPMRSNLSLSGAMVMTSRWEEPAFRRSGNQHGPHGGLAFGGGKTALSPSNPRGPPRAVICWTVIRRSR